MCGGLRHSRAFGRPRALRARLDAKAVRGRRGAPAALKERRGTGRPTVDARQEMQARNRHDEEAQMERTGFSAGSWADRRKTIQPISVSRTQLVKIGHLPAARACFPW
jgi:hypothetical protein